MADIGKRLLPVTLDAIAQSEPDRPWGSMPRHGMTDFYDIPFKNLANAINRTARWIVDQVGTPQVDTFPTIAYLGPSDLRYYVMLLAILKAGYKPLFTSHRNSQTANASLFTATQCNILLNAFTDFEALPTGHASDSIRRFQVPSSEELWDPEPVAAFPFTKSFEDAFNDPFVILHTSGSTGNPKPVIYTHGVMASADLRQTLEAPPGTQTEVMMRHPYRRLLLGFPPFHAAGLLCGLQDTIWYGHVLVFPPTSRPLDAEMVSEILPASQAEGALLLPNVLEQIARSPIALDAVRRYLKYLIWVGGPISTEAGEAISRATQLMQTYATTEIGSLNTLTPKRAEDWNYHWFMPGENGFEFRPVPSDAADSAQPQLYELVVKRDPRRMLHVFLVFRDLDEWATNDLFSRHPERPDLWRHEGRADDLIVLENGGNLNPRPIEVALCKHPSVRGALVTGARRARPAVVLEPVAEVDAAGRAAFVDSIMPAVEESNQVASMNGRIERELVLVADPARPFPRTGKGTVQRGAAMKLYAADIYEAYDALPQHLRKSLVERVQGTSV